MNLPGLLVPWSLSAIPGVDEYLLKSDPPDLVDGWAGTVTLTVVAVELGLVEVSKVVVGHGVVGLVVTWAVKGVLAVVVVDAGVGEDLEAVVEAVGAAVGDRVYTPITSRSVQK